MLIHLYGFKIAIIIIIISPIIKNTDILFQKLDSISIVYGVGRTFIICTSDTTSSGYLLQNKTKYCNVLIKHK